MKQCACVLAVVLTLFVNLESAYAQQRNEGVARAPSAAPQRRVALVIGNAAYKAVSPLDNPTNDAQDMADVLRGFGFAVNLKLNASKQDMQQSLRELGAELKRGGVGLFYYAGHGVQSNGQNYLIPVDANISSEAELEARSVDLTQVLGLMGDAKNGVNVVILDACRNNPFARSFRPASRGLAPVDDAPVGTYIAYATGPGSIASDGTGRNGLFTQYLLESLRGPDTGVENVFKRVRRFVQEATGGKQITWELSSLTVDLAFNPRSVTQAAQNPQPRIDPAAFEPALWNEIKDRRKPDEYRVYLALYPNGRYATQARAHINALPQATPAVIQDPARVMIGAWFGAYAYGTRAASVPASVPFKLTITSINGLKFEGLMSEPATFGNRTSGFLFAKVTGTVDGPRVRYTKTYDGTGGVTHSVNYQGVLDRQAGALRGDWSIESPNGKTTGTFEAAKS